MLKIAIQAKGRLNEDCVRLLNDSGITITTGSRMLLSHAQGFPLDVLYLRDDDIPMAVAMGVADIGIVGLNEVKERGADVNVAMELGFGKCRISLAVPKDSDYKGLDWFNGKRIATSYPNILAGYLKERNINAGIVEIAGSVELAPAIGLADSIFDIVSSGSTLVQNGLVEVEAVLQSQAVLVASKGLDQGKLEELAHLEFRFGSIKCSRGMKYVLMNLPESAIESALGILPSMKSPTLLPLAEKGWYSLHTVIGESELWDKIEQLKAVGAEDILVLQLENLIR